MLLRLQLSAKIIDADSLAIPNFWANASQAGDLHFFRRFCISIPDFAFRSGWRGTHRRGLGEGQRANHYTDMHAAMRGHGTILPSGNILKARALEQGSRIVAAPPDDIYVVLELPRGNLETIYPRSLVLPAVAAAVQVLTLLCLLNPPTLYPHPSTLCTIQWIWMDTDKPSPTNLCSLNDCMLQKWQFTWQLFSSFQADLLSGLGILLQDADFAKAWQLATAHRVDLNLLVDYSWPSFLSRAGAFVDQVSDDQDIIDLLSALREESVIEDGGLYAGLPPAIVEEAADKVDNQVIHVQGIQ